MDGGQVTVSTCKYKIGDNVLFEVEGFNGKMVLYYGKIINKAKSKYSIKDQNGEVQEV